MKRRAPIRTQPISAPWTSRGRLIAGCLKESASPSKSWMMLSASRAGNAHRTSQWRTTLFHDLFAKIFRAHIQSHGDHDGPTNDHETEPLERVIVDGWIDGVIRYPTKRTQRLATQSGHVEGIVWHWTATAGGTGKGLSARAVELPKPGQHVGSWHLLIERDGTVYQSAPLTVGTWHAGGGSAKRFGSDPGRNVWAHQPAGKISANGWACGIELACVGEVRNVGGKWQGWPFGKDGKKGPIVDPSEVQECDGRMYQGFTDKQIESAGSVLRSILTLGVKKENCSWSHEMIDPGRKTDPGPIWMGKILPDLLSRS